MALSNATYKQIYDEFPTTDVGPDDIVLVRKKSTGQVHGILGSDLFQTDTNDFTWKTLAQGGSYSIDDVVVYDGKWWISLVNANEDNIPTEGPNWSQINRVSATVIKPWQAGVYDKHYALVLYNKRLYYLSNTVTLPYDSTDIAAEITAGDWVGSAVLLKTSGLGENLIESTTGKWDLTAKGSLANEGGLYIDKTSTTPRVDLYATNDNTDYFGYARCTAQVVGDTGDGTGMQVVVGVADAAELETRLVITEDGKVVITCLKATFEGLTYKPATATKVLANATENSLMPKSYIDTAVNNNVVSKSAAYTIVAADKGKIIECSGTFTLTVGAGIPAEFNCTIVNVGTGTITIAGDTGVTVNGKGLTMTEQWGGATLYNNAVDSFRLIGDLT